MGVSDILVLHDPQPASSLASSLSKLDRSDFNGLLAGLYILEQLVGANNAEEGIRA